MIFLCFSAYIYDTSASEVLFAVAAVLLGFFVQYASIEVPKAPLPGQPSKWEVWFRTIPALLAVFLLSWLIDISATAEETLIVVLVFYPLKTLIEFVALMLSALSEKLELPVKTARRR